MFHVFDELKLDDGDFDRIGSADGSWGVASIFLGCRSSPRKIYVEHMWCVSRIKVYGENGSDAVTLVYIHTLSWTAKRSHILLHFWLELTR